MPVAGLALASLLGYLIGATPSGVIVGRLRGVDPRTGGSGRTGATNAMRTLGTGLAVLVLLADVAKGALAVLLGGWLAAAFGGPEAWGAAAFGGPEAWGAALGGIAAVTGHVRSVFIGFSGGRGVATGAGVMLVLAPLTLLLAVPVLVLAVWRTRYVSLGSILAALTVAVVAAGLALAGAIGLEAMVAAILVAAVVIVAHADNIDRLRSGTERRLGGG